MFDLIAKHKFYLAFENSCCQDYVSEKILNAFRSGVVPVVAGPRDYSTYAPTDHSVINVRDFESPRHLAAYLDRVASNRTLYESYLSYKPSVGAAPLTEKFKAVWADRGPWSVFCEIGEEVLRYDSSSKWQTGRAVNPIIPAEQCEEEGYLRKAFVEGFSTGDRLKGAHSACVTRMYDGISLLCVRETLLVT